VSNFITLEIQSGESKKGTASPSTPPLDGQINLKLALAATDKGRMKTPPENNANTTTVPNAVGGAVAVTGTNNGTALVTNLAASAFQKKVLPPINHKGGNDSALPSPRTLNESAIWSASEITSNDEIGATRLRRDHMFIERVISALEVSPNDCIAKEAQSILMSVLRIVANLITLASPPTDQQQIKDDILSLSSLPSLVVKHIKGFINIASPSVANILAEAIRVFGILTKYSYSNCRNHYIRTMFPCFQQMIDFPHNNTFVVQEMLIEV
jgi:hypothetical protein